MSTEVVEPYLDCVGIEKVRKDDHFPKWKAPNMY